MGLDRCLGYDPRLKDTSLTTVVVYCGNVATHLEKRLKTVVVQASIVGIYAATFEIHPLRLSKRQLFLLQCVIGRYMMM